MMKAVDRRGKIWWSGGGKHGIFEPRILSLGFSLHRRIMFADTSGRLRGSSNMNTVGYTKLASSILTSTIWVESDQTVRVWITLLALCDRNGFVSGTVPGLASVARVSVEDCRKAIEKFLGPDPDSRTENNEGRRLEKKDGGWYVINFLKYRSERDQEARKEQTRRAVAKHRACKPNVSRGKPQKAQAEAEAEALREEKESAPPTLSPLIQEIQEAWNNSLGLSKCVNLTKERLKTLKLRCSEPFFVANWVAALFKARDSSFCRGENDRSWKANFEWFIRPNTVTELMEGKYDGTNKKAGPINARNVGVCGDAAEQKERLVATIKRNSQRREAKLLASQMASNGDDRQEALGLDQCG